MIIGALFTMIYMLVSGLVYVLPTGDSAFIAHVTSSFIQLFSYLNYANTFLPVSELIISMKFAINTLLLLFSLKVINFIYRLIRGKELFTFGSTSGDDDSGALYASNETMNRARIQNTRGRVIKNGGW